MTSPLQSALKPGMESDEYNDALQQIKEALNARTSKPFDPTLMAIAQGFLTPTATGSFGEGLGQVAKSVMSSQDQQQKEAMDVAQMRLQIAQAEREQKDLARARQTFQDKYTSYGEPPVPLTSEDGARTEVQSANPSKMKTVTVQDALDFAAAFPNQKGMATMLMDAAKANSDRFKIAQNGTVFDTFTGEYVNKRAPGQTQSDYTIPGIGTFKMTPYEYDTAMNSFDKARGEGWGADWAKQFKGGISAPKSPQNVSVDETPLTRKTSSEMEAEAAAKKKTAEKTAEATVDTTTQFKKSGQAALGLIPLYERAEGILKATPGLKNSLGVLEKGDFVSAIGSVADEGVRIGSLNINIPSFRKIASQYAQDPKTINALAELAQVEAMWQFQQRQGLGSGTSVSNFEQQMVNQMGPNIKDPYDAYVKKLAFMKAKADFDRAVGQELKGGKQYEDFEGSNRFNQLFEQYKKKIMPIVYDATSAKQPSSGTSKVNPASRDALYKALQ